MSIIIVIKLTYEEIIMTKKMITYEATYYGMRETFKTVNANQFSDGEQVHDGYEEESGVTERFEARSDDDAVAKATSNNLLKKLGLTLPELTRLCRLEEVKFVKRTVVKK